VNDLEKLYNGRGQGPNFDTAPVSSTDLFCPNDTGAQFLLPAYKFWIFVAMV
jgi:hypothetical protein